MPSEASSGSHRGDSGSGECSCLSVSEIMEEQLWSPTRDQRAPPTGLIDRRKVRSASTPNRQRMPGTTFSSC